MSVCWAPDFTSFLNGASPPHFWSCNGLNSHLRWVPSLPRYPPWILHVNYGFELFLLLLESPALRPPGACLPGLGRAAGEAGGVRQAGSQPAAVRSTDCNGLSFFFFFFFPFSLPTPFLPYPARLGCLLPPWLAIWGWQGGVVVSRGCVCLLFGFLKGEIETASGGGGGSGGVCPQPRSTPLATKSPLLPASAVN